MNQPDRTSDRTSDRTTTRASSHLATGLRTTLWLFLAIGLVAASLGFVLTGVTGLPLWDSVDYVLLAVLVAAVAWGIPTLWGHVRARGRLLADCGPQPYRWVLLGVGGWFTFQALQDLLLAGPWSGVLVLLVACAAFLAVGLGRLQVFEGGLWTYLGLLRWNEITHYHWNLRGDLVLERSYGFPFPWVRTVAIKVPPAHRAAIEGALGANGVAKSAPAGSADPAPGHGPA